LAFLFFDYIAQAYLMKVILETSRVH